MKVIANNFGYGIQHLAAIMLDLELGTDVNLNSFDENNCSNDIYTKLVDPINMAINKYGMENQNFFNLRNVKFNRKILKTSIMTKVYNVTAYGIAQQLKSKLENISQNLSKNGFNLEKIKTIINFNSSSLEIEKIILSEISKNLVKNKYEFYIAPSNINSSIVLLSKSEIFKIATIINEQIFVLYPSLNNIYNYFIDTAKLIIDLGIPLSWITPTGMKITQNYLKSKQTTISIRFAGRTRKSVLREWTNILNKHKQTQAIIPNIIHSLDATHLINIIINAESNKFSPLISIHDCFSTLPNKMGELEHNIKKEFILLYSQNNFLETFHNRIIQSIKDNNLNIIERKNENYVLFYDCNSNSEIELKIPNLPALGKLDLENIINSKYMIN